MNHGAHEVFCDEPEMVAKAGRTLVQIVLSFSVFSLLSVVYLEELFKLLILSALNCDSEL